MARDFFYTSKIADNKVNDLITRASKAIKEVDNISMEDMYMIGCTDVFVRLKRNVAAIKMLLEQIDHAQDLVAKEINIIAEEKEKYIAFQEMKKKEALEREKRAKLEKKRYQEKKIKKRQKK